MKLNLSGVRDIDRAEEPFSYKLDLSGTEHNGAFPVPDPVQVNGTVRNNAGVLTLDAVMSAGLSLTCDRCAVPFKRNKTLEVSCVLAQSLEQDDSDDIFVYSGDCVELDDIFVPAFLLELEMKNLCGDDCKGLCPRCGHNLNHGDCDCVPESDPRWDKLKELL